LRPLKALTPSSGLKLVSRAHPFWPHRSGPHSSCRSRLRPFRCLLSLNRRYEYARFVTRSIAVPPPWFSRPGGTPPPGIVRGLRANGYRCFDLWELTQTYLEVHGRAFWYLSMDPALGVPDEIWVLPSQNLTPKRAPDSRRPIDYYEYRTGATEQRFG